MKNVVEPAALSTSSLTILLMVPNCEVTKVHLGVTPVVPGATFRDTGPCGGGLS